MILIMLYLILVAGNKILEYRLGSNYGPSVTDYSGNNFHGVSGYYVQSHESSYDVVFTDRGAFFSGTSFIKLPSNDIVSSYIQLPSIFSVSMWVLSQNSGGNLMFKLNDLLNYFYMYRSSSTDSLKLFLIAQGEQSLGILESPSGTFPHSDF